MTSKSQVYLAVDLGASSGRVVAGMFDGAKLTLEDVHRFENGGIVMNDRMQWDILALWHRIVEGLRLGANKYGDSIVGVGVDTWGVDFGLLGRGDELLGNPYHYRDQRTTGLMQQSFQTVSREEIFEESGLQFMEINTLYQLIAMRLGNSPLLEMAQSFLMIPDLINFFLSGQKSNEFSNATTTQLFNPRTMGWSQKLISKFDLPKSIFGETIQPGTCLGKIRPSVAEQTGLRNVDIIVPGTHDTASAVMAVPATSRPGQQPDWCYISSGTWSLMGVEVPQPVVNERCRQLNFTNEGGVGKTTRLLKNIAGLWLVQECRRSWRQAGRDFTWDHLVDLAHQSPPLVSLINPDHANLVAPKDMPTAIREFCKSTGQPVPESEGAVIRCALESLALRYRMVHGWLEELVGNAIHTIHIVGGGTQNRLLCQMAADACNRQVVAGPIEATAIGNVMIQAVSHGAVGSIAEAREAIRRSFYVEQYSPKNSEPWNEAYDRFQKLLTR